MVLCEKKKISRITPGQVGRSVFILLFVLPALMLLASCQDVKVTVPVAPEPHSNSWFPMVPGGVWGLALPSQLGTDHPAVFSLYLMVRKDQMPLVAQKLSDGKEASLRELSQFLYENAKGENQDCMYLLRIRVVVCEKNLTAFKQALYEEMDEPQTFGLKQWVVQTVSFSAPDRLNYSVPPKEEIQSLSSLFSQNGTAIRFISRQPQFMFGGPPVVDKPVVIGRVEQPIPADDCQFQDFGVVESDNVLYLFARGIGPVRIFRKGSLGDPGYDFDGKVMQSHMKLPFLDRACLRELVYYYFPGKNPIEFCNTAFLLFK